MERRAYIWNLPRLEGERRGHAMRLRADGVETVQVKAGGDDGRLWEAWADPRAVQPYRDEGLRVIPWFYTWPTDADIDVVVRAIRAQPFDEYSLNPEIEWRTDSPRNPWRTVEQANEAATDWLRKMESALPGVMRAFSSVPSWVGFPYEAWAGGCWQAEPQHYWPADLLANVYGRDYDQVGYHYIRTPNPDKPVVPILTASREYDDAGVLALARAALRWPIDGFTSWEAGNSAYQYAAMRAAYQLLPDLLTGGTEDVKEPAAGTYASYVNGRGEAIFVFNMGGQAGSPPRTDIQSMSLTVDSATDPTKQVTRGIVDQLVMPFFESPKLTIVGAFAVEAPQGEPRVTPERP